MAGRELGIRHLWSGVLVWGVITTLAAPASDETPVRAASPFEANYLRLDPGGTLRTSPDPFPETAGFSREWRVGDTTVGSRWASRLAADTTLGGDGPPPPFPRGHSLNRWTDQEGLPANKVRSLLATSDGYLWVGTVGGLARFDGLSFTLIDAAAEPALAENGTIARAMFEDTDGRLWIATERGLLCHHVGRFTEIDGARELQGQTANDLAARSAGGAWLAADSGVYACTAGGVRRLEIDGLDGSSRIISVAEESGANRLWVGGVGALYAVDLTLGDAMRFSAGEFSSAHFDFSSQLYQLHLDHAEKLWAVGTAGAVRLELPSGGEPERLLTLPTGTFVHCPRVESLGDGQRLRWAVDRFGDLVELDPNGDAIETIPFRSGDVMCLARDRFGSLWIGTRLGLFRFRWKAFAIASVPGTSRFDAWRWLAEGPGGAIWIGNPWWIARWSGNSVTVFDSGTELRDTFFYALGVSAGGRAWAGRADGGIVPFPQSGEILTNRAPLAPTSTGFPRLELVAPRSAGGIWAASAGTVLPVAEDGIAGQPIPGPFGEPHALHEDSHGQLWVGAEEGLFQTPTTPAAGATLVPCPDIRGGVRAVFEDRDGAFWAAGSHGLSVRFDGAWRQVVARGLPLDRTFGIADDASGHLWLQLEDEILRLPRAQLRSGGGSADLGWQVRRFWSGDGLLNAHCAGKRSRVVEGSDGRLWFPMTGGVAVVDPATVPDRPPPAPVQLESIVAGNEPVTPRALSGDPPPGARDRLRFNFTQPELLEPTRVEFQFRLDGHDRDWRDAGPARHATYTGLAAGNYAFQVRARHPDDRWQGDGVSLAFRLERFFWEQWTFWAGGGILAIVVPLGLTGWLRLRQARLLQQERAAAADAERRRLAQDAHDHLGAHLARANLHSNSDTRRRLMSELDGIIWLQHPENDCVEGLVDFLLTFPHEYFANSGDLGPGDHLPPVEFDIPTDLPNLPLNPDQRRNLAGIYKESLRNIAQHAGATRVDVSLRIDPQHHHLTLTVADDGSGFSPESPAAGRNGHGLRNLAERGIALGGSTSVQSKPGRGTTVTATVPLPEAAPRRNKRATRLTRWLKKT